ncbi:Hypothetical predicted protein [Marmota monax]|uniref:RCC1-like domain-containing protein n=1 Tax=Marmota monax TaxID=9995 RepID=A0A5E4AEI2_MARMO|nr:Hypothetical predicted protein [Marmota monax]
MSRPRIWVQVLTKDYGLRYFTGGREDSRTGESPIEEVGSQSVSRVLCLGPNHDCDPVPLHPVDPDPLLQYLSFFGRDHGFVFTGPSDPPTRHGPQPAPYPIPTLSSKFGICKVTPLPRPIDTSRVCTRAPFTWTFSSTMFTVVLYRCVVESGFYRHKRTPQDNNGVIGLLEPMKKSMVPLQVQLDIPVVKVASGNDHLVMLTTDGDLYTLGCGEQGQLGRVPELFSNRGGRQGLERLLVPKCVMLKSRGAPGHVRFQDAFCGAYFTFAISQDGHIYGFGLSNYHQLGTPGTESCFIPQNLTCFKNSTKSWVCFSGGQHHTVCLDSEGKAYSLGRAEYGRLGLGEGAEEKSIPTLISRLPTVVSVACGASVGYAVTKDGRVFAWGMGTNYQLGTGQDEDAWSPVEMTGKQLENRMVLSVSSGGQHTVLLVKDKEQS